MLSQATIQQITDVAERFRPEKILLFGSYARGEVHANSDLDLLVVMDTVAPRGQRPGLLKRMLISKVSNCFA